MQNPWALPVPLLLLLRQPQLTGHDPHDRRAGRVPAFRPELVQFGNHSDEARERETEGGSSVVWALLMINAGAAKEFPGPLCVSGYSSGLALADLHGSCGEMDESLNESSLGRGSAEGIPEALPSLMRFPVPAAIEEVHGVEPLRVGGERGGKHAASGGGVGWERGRASERPRDPGGLRATAEGMAAGVGHRVRQVVAGHVRVGWQRIGRSIAWWHGMKPTGLGRRPVHVGGPAGNQLRDRECQARLRCHIETPLKAKPASARPHVEGSGTAVST